MKLPRRNFLHLAAGAAALPAVPRFAWAQSYPWRPVRIVVTFSAGSTSDILARPMAQWLQERLGQPFVVDNRPGAGGTIGIETVAGISRETGLMVVNPSVPAKTVPEFIAYAKANPGKINMASAGIGAS